MPMTARSFTVPCLGAMHRCFPANGRLRQVGRMQVQWVRVPEPRQACASRRAPFVPTSGPPGATKMPSLDKAGRLLRASAMFRSTPAAAIGALMGTRP
jgi:hypothetical protein